MRPFVVILIGLLSAHSPLSAQRYLTPVLESVVVMENEVYGMNLTYDGIPQELICDVYTPAMDTETARPLVIYCHGGGFTDVNQSKDLPHIQDYCDSLARRGYVVASMNYRLDSTICNRAIVNAMHDMKAAIRYFRSEAEAFGIDPDMVFVMGESAGAVTSLSAGYIDEGSEVLSPSSAPYPLDTSVEGSSGNPGESSSVKAVLSLCGGTLVIGSGIVFDTLAIQSPSDPPLVVVHGSDDPLVPIVSALDLELRAQHVGLPSLFYVLEGATHCPWFTSLPDASAYMDTLIDSTVPFMYACVSSVVDGVGENDSFSGVRMAPNPATGPVYIEWEPIDSPMTVEVLDPRGRRLSSQSADVGASQVEVDLQGLDAGVYLIRLSSGNRQWEERVVKE